MLIITHLSFLYRPNSKMGFGLHLYFIINIINVFFFFNVNNNLHCLFKLTLFLNESGDQ